MNNAADNSNSTLGSTLISALSNFFYRKAKNKKLFLTIALTAVTTGCSSTDDSDFAAAQSNKIDWANQSTLISEFYANVQSVKPVELDSNVEEGMVGGAAIGLIENADGNSEEMVAGTIAGALVGGLFTAIFEGSNKAYQYQISSPTHGEFSVVQKEQLPESATCIKVQSGSKVVMTPVDEHFCQANNEEQVLAKASE